MSRHYADPESLAVMWGLDGCEKGVFENAQEFDLDGLEGRLLSSSYAPGPGHARHEAMIAALRVLFSDHQVEGRVRFEYDTEVYLGVVSG